LLPPSSVTPIPGNLSATISDGDVSNVNAADDDAGEYNYFGDVPNPDPEDDSPRDLCGAFVPLFAKSRKIAKDYSKDRKIRIFYDALTVSTNYYNETSGNNETNYYNELKY